MKLYSLHICLVDNPDSSKEDNCLDPELHAETRELALTYGKIKFPNAKNIRVQSEMGIDANGNEDWIDYED